MLAYLKKLKNEELWLLAVLILCTGLAQVLLTFNNYPWFLPKLIVVTLFVLTPLIFHEIGHWAMLHRFKVPIKHIHLGHGPTLMSIGNFLVKLLPIGAAIEPEPSKYDLLAPKQKIQVALAGPFTSAMYGILCYSMVLLNLEVDGIKNLMYIAHFNALLAIVNLLPIPPLDGYHVLIQYYEDKGEPFSAKMMKLFYRLGNAVVYGVGFFVIGSVFFK